MVFELTFQSQALIFFTKNVFGGGVMVLEGIVGAS